MKMQDLVESLSLLSPGSKASEDMAKGVVLGVVNLIMLTTPLKLHEVWEHIIRWMPDDFRITALPYEWLDIGQPLSNHMIHDLEAGHVIYFDYLLKDLPEEQLDGSHDGRSVRDQLLGHYLREVSLLNMYGLDIGKPSHNMGSWRQAGSQSIAEFWVNDLYIENDPRNINWHGQNTSQWCYAGAICVQNGRVSTHH
ncbi:MAG: hypothetical protein DRQ42_00445 [Gammaproteobacteria bacterium]|nr:MAG: hypothetical protein DRQ42_00445 [Gammaproteobacteria bacterium]